TLGKSNQEIAALSRSSHQSQGFGTTGNRGDETEYLELINGTPLKDNSNLFEGIDTSWNRIKEGKPIGDLLTKISSEYDFNSPSTSIPNLIKAYQMIQSLKDSHWKTIKSEEVKNCIANCAGLYLEAVSNQQEITPGTLLKLKIEAINRTTNDVQLISVTTLPNKTTIPQNKVLRNNQINKIDIDFQIPQTIDYTQPYWLKETGSLGMYAVSNQENIGIPDIIRETKVVFNVKINQVEIPFERTIVYKQNSPVKGEMYQYLDISPEVTTSFLNNVSLFNHQKNKTIAVRVKAGKEEIKGNLKLELPDNWIVTPTDIPFEIKKKGTEKLFYFDVTPPLESTEVFAKSIIKLNEKQYDNDQITIDYPHITKQQILKSAKAKFIKLDLKIGTQKIGYIMGAGDAIPESLIQMGYDLTLLNPEEINTETLKSLDVIITGIRAYNVIEELVSKQQILFNFVKEGKTMLVQYNTPSLLPEVQLAPYPLKISSDRVTEENATVHFINPNHPALNYPNKITTNDFKGWTQEQGLYYPNEYDAAFTPILSSNDTGESPKNGALLIASYGKGYYIYTGLSFFRELPEGVSGAYRLMANLIALKNTPTEIKPTKP
ncbi:LmbE family protein, partial [Flavobacterium sp.]|uniref:LmbE family protein n=1 Tax=Flavobacterium sp. TaxID=239 RepID=UPI003C3EFF03